MEIKAFAMALCLESGTGVQHRTLRGEDQGWHGLNLSSSRVSTEYQTLDMKSNRTEKVTACNLSSREKY